jgi:hypothetical protein
MRQTPPDFNGDSPATRSKLRPAAAVAAGVVALAIGAFVLVAERNGRGSDGYEPGHSRAVPFAATTNTNPAVAIDAAKPKFERSDEPAYEDTVQAHGG